MSDKNMNHDLAVMAGMGITTSQEQGTIPSGVEVSKLINIDPKTGKKRDTTAQTIDLIQKLQSIQVELNDIFEQINGKLDEFKTSRDRQNRMANAEKTGDFDTLRLIFINEYGMNTEKVNNMSHDQLRNQRIKFDELEQQNQTVIILEIRELAEQYRERAKLLGETRPDLEQAELDKLDAIKYKCAALGLDFEKIFSDTAQNEHTNLHSAFNKNKENDLNNEFNKVAPQISDNPISLNNENNLFSDTNTKVIQDTPSLFN